MLKSNLQEMLCEDKRESFRLQIIKKIDFKRSNPEDWSLYVVRSQDSSKKVRAAFFERLCSENIDIESLQESDRLTVIRNGLSDPEQAI